MTKANTTKNTNDKTHLQSSKKNKPHMAIINTTNNTTQIQLMPETNKTKGKNADTPKNATKFDKRVMRGETDKLRRKQILDYNQQV